MTCSYSSDLRVTPASLAVLKLFLPQVYINKTFCKSAVALVMLY